jgi:hypothetical protein
MIAENLKRVWGEIAEASLRAGRTPESVKLIAVSKTKPVSAVLEAYEAGQRIFGENYVQEWLTKFADERLQTLPIEWHFVGHLQSNKVRYVAEKISMIHGVDKLSLAEEISKRAKNISAPFPSCLKSISLPKAQSMGFCLMRCFQKPKKFFRCPILKSKA